MESEFILGLFLPPLPCSALATYIYYTLNYPTLVPVNHNSGKFFRQAATLHVDDANKFRKERIAQLTAKCISCNIIGHFGKVCQSKDTITTNLSAVNTVTGILRYPLHRLG